MNESSKIFVKYALRVARMQFRKTVSNPSVIAVSLVQSGPSV